MHPNQLTEDLVIPSPFLLWYKDRITQYSERTDRNLVEACNHLNKIASFKMRNAEIDSIVEPIFHYINRPKQ